MQEPSEHKVTTDVSKEEDTGNQVVRGEDEKYEETELLENIQEQANGELTISTDQTQDAQSGNSKGSNECFDPQVLSEIREQIVEKLISTTSDALESLKTELCTNVERDLSGELKIFKDSAKHDRKNYQVATALGKLCNEVDKYSTNAHIRAVRDILPEEFIEDLKEQLLYSYMPQEPCTRQDAAVYNDCNKNETSEVVEETLELAIKYSLHLAIAERIFDNLNKDGSSQEVSVSEDEDQSEDEGVELDDPFSDLKDVMVSFLGYLMEAIRSQLIKFITDEFNETWILKGFIFELEAEDEKSLTKYWHEDVDGALDNTKAIVTKKLKPLIRDSINIVIKNKLDMSPGSKVTENQKQDLIDAIMVALMIRVAREVKKAMAICLYRQTQIQNTKWIVAEDSTFFLQEEVRDTIEHCFPQDLNRSPWVSKVGKFPEDLCKKFESDVERCLIENL